MTQHGFLTSITTTNGRTNRKRYVLYSVAVVAVSVVLMMFDPTLWASEGGETGRLGGIVYLVSAIAHLILFIRRSHDVNRSGWLALLIIVPLVNIAVGLYAIFAKGTQGPNRFGPDPLNQVAPAVA